MMQLRLARGEHPTKGGDYIIIISAPGHYPNVPQEIPGPSLPHPLAKEALGWGQAAAAPLSRSLGTPL